MDALRAGGDEQEVAFLVGFESEDMNVVSG